LLERGFTAHDDGTPLALMRITDQWRLPVTEVLAVLPSTAAELVEGDFDLDDDEYAQLVKRVVADEIGTGEGSNFVLMRNYRGVLAGYSLAHSLAIYRRLLDQELGAYWTFLIHTQDRTLIGASPEQHVGLEDGLVTMNPISGTYRYPGNGPDIDEMLAFLADRKEADELYMVVDEELKMMSRICDPPVRVEGPWLKEMARLAHTEYRLIGRTQRDVPEILRETMFAPTVTGSPVENATKVIAQHEPRGRGYYAGVAALVSSRRGRRSLDSAILIRTADVDSGGHVQIGVGATLVRHSDPYAEAAETRAKASGILMAIEGRQARQVATASDGLGQDPRVTAALASRNQGLASFWLDATRSVADETLAGRRVLVIDAEDTFTAMLAAQIRALGATVVIRRFDEQPSDAWGDLIVVGPGPGDPRDLADPKIAMLRCLTQRLLAQRIPFMSVCLGHQVLCKALGLPLRRLPTPAQGEQRRVDLFGDTRLVGFYNTFAAVSPSDLATTPWGLVEVWRDRATGEVHALRGRGFRSIQFHVESILTEDGLAILRQLFGGLLAEATS
jgi:phenazine biosynthesis protein phzE